MTNNKSELILNIAPISFNREKITIGRLPNVQGDKYLQLREDNWETHAFRFDSRTEDIVNVALAPNVEPLGQKEEVNIHEHLLLIARAIQHHTLLWLAHKRQILFAKKALVFWGQADDALLLSNAVEEIGEEIISGLEVALRYEIDCRMFRYNDDKFYLGLVVDLATSNVIDIPVSELLKHGFNPIGYYVGNYEVREEEYLRPKFNLLGKVASIKEAQLLLTDTESVTQVDASEAFLEPRHENLQSIVHLYFGPKAPAILKRLSNLRIPINSSIDKLAQIERTIASLQKRQMTIAGDVQVQIENLLNPTSNKFPEIISTERPTLLFGPQGRKTGTWPDGSLTTHGPYMYMQHDRNSPLIVVVCESQFRGRVEQFIRSLRDGYPAEQWKNKSRPNPYVEGLLGKFRLSSVRVEYAEVSSPTAQSYREAISQTLNQLPETPDLAIVQIRESFMQLYGENNPYFVSKAALMTAGIPTQSVRIENIDLLGDGLAYLLNNVALASYAKLDGTPWVMSTRGTTTHEIVLGLGATVAQEGRLGIRKRYVGITSVFQGDGRYLVWGATREVEFEQYPEALLETLRAVVRYVRQHNAWENGDNVRLVCHVYKPLKDCEAQAVKQLVSELLTDYSVEFAFLDISWWHPYYIFAPQENGVSYFDWEQKVRGIKGKGVPRRGLCLQLDGWRGILQLTGPSELKTMTQGLPSPLLVELHRDSDFTDMGYLLRQIYHFSYMSWRSFFPASEPVTIIYSRLISRLLGNLRAVNGWNSSVLAVGSLRNRRWFL